MQDDAETRARRATAILTDDLFSEVMATMETRYTEAIRYSDSLEMQKREDAYRMLRALDELRSEFQSIIDNARVLDERLKRKS